MRSIITKALMMGVAAAACVGAMTVPASAAPLAGSSSATDAVDTGSASEPWIYEIGATVKAGKDVVLDQGLESTYGLRSFEQVKAADGSPAGMRLKWDSSQSQAHAFVSYKLNIRDKSTPYFARIGVYHDGDYWNANGMCEIFDSKPFPGLQPTWSSPFECTTHKHGLDNDFDFTVELLSLAEASGTIHANDVALTDGMGHSDAGYSRAADTQVAKGGSTKFDALLLKGDKPFYENQARTEWAYQIVDNGEKTGRWVAGLATNHRGTWFSADGRCAIYAANPLADGGRLDDHGSIDDSPYTCTATGEILHGPGESDNRHFDGTFTVSRK